MKWWQGDWKQTVGLWTLAADHAFDLNRVRRAGNGDRGGREEGGKKGGCVYVCVETARPGTRCSRHRLMWFFYTTKGGSGEGEEQTVWKCEKSWELEWMDINTSHPSRIVFLLTWDFQHLVLISVQQREHPSLFSKSIIKSMSND